jgi:hypothetical protein
MMQAAGEWIETFERDSSELYWLAYLLTGNTDRSVQAFDKALDFAENENPAFEGFMKTWSRKLIVVEALGTIRRELRTSIARTARQTVEPQERLSMPRPEIGREAFENAVIAIDTFPRCAMLLTIFEAMSLEAASILLGADEARTKIAQQIGIVQLTRNLTENGGRDPYREPGISPVPVLSLG